MKLLIIFSLIGLIGCADNEERNFVLEDTDTNTNCSISNNVITCPDGTQVQVNQDQVLLTETKVPNNTCTQVTQGVFVENIQNGKIFDVYSNSMCVDTSGEFCDNVKPSYGSSGQFGENKRGNGTVCSFGNLLLFGEKVGNDLIIKIVEFK